MDGYIFILKFDKIESGLKVRGMIEMWRNKNAKRYFFKLTV